jgi:hypothetical protein
VNRSFDFLLCSFQVQKSEQNYCIILKISLTSQSATIIAISTTSTGPGKYCVDLTHILAEENPVSKTISFLVLTDGIGKTYAADLIAKSFYKNGVNSKYVH